MKNILWVIAIACMVFVSFTAYPDIIKTRVIKPKKSKSQQQRDKKKHIEYEFIESDKQELVAR